MKDKKSFVLYSDLIHTVNQLPEDKAGLLFKHILSYVNDENPQTDDIIVKIAFEPIKQQLKRDLLKYEKKREQYSEAGKKSAEARAVKKKQEEKEAKNKSNERQRTLTNVESRSTNSTVSVNVNVNDNVINKDKEKALSYWLDYRKEIKKPIKSKKTLESLIKKFNKTDIVRVREVVKYSVDGSYQGLFWEDAPKGVRTVSKENETTDDVLERIAKETREKL